MMSKLSLGDARAYYLSTAKNELGVVSAQSIAGMKGCNIQFVCTNTWNCSHRCNIVLLILLPMCFSRWCIGSNQLD